MQKRQFRTLIKITLGIFTSILSILLFGLCIPCLLLSLEVLPGLGVVGILYLIAGGIVGLILGGILSRKTLSGSTSIFPRPYVILTVGLALAVMIYYICYLNIDPLQKNL
jgi:hypothetical protein